MNIILLGKGGSGKTTYMKKRNMKLCKWITDRTQRSGEQDNDSIFVSKEEFDLIPNKLIVQEFNVGYRYALIEEEIINGDVITINPKYVHETPKKYLESVDHIWYIYCDKQELERRQLQRIDKNNKKDISDIKLRIESDLYTFADIDEYIKTIEPVIIDGQKFYEMKKYFI